MFIYFYTHILTYLLLQNTLIHSYILIYVYSKKNKRLSKELKKLTTANEPASSFTLNVTDDRFSALLQGDARFGIDPTSTLYKPTEGMKAILQEQRRRKRPSDDLAVPDEATGNGNVQQHDIAIHTNNTHTTSDVPTSKRVKNSDNGDNDSIQAVESNVNDAKMLAKKLKSKYKQ